MALSVKSCGKAHSWCRVCRPDVASNHAASVSRPEFRENAAARRDHLATMTANAARRNKGIKRSDETRALMSAAQNEHWSDPAARARLGSTQRERLRDPDARALLASANLRHMESCVNPDCQVVTCSRQPITGQTSIERILIERVLSSFYEVIPEARFGRYRVDAYVPEVHIAFEADGAYWHALRPGRDEARDAYLLREFNLPVVRFTESELRAWL